MSSNRSTNDSRHGRATRSALQRITIDVVDSIAADQSDIVPVFMDVRPSIRVVEIRVLKEPIGSVVALVSIVVDSFVLSNCLIRRLKRKGGFDATLPRVLDKNGLWQPLVRCTNPPLEELISKKILNVWTQCQRSLELKER